MKDRLADCGAKVLAHERPSSGARVEDIRGELPALEHVVHVTHGQRTEPSDGIVLWDDLIGRRSRTSSRLDHGCLRTTPIMHYTSGTTGKPKGAAHVHQAVWGHYATGKYVLDLHEDDIYWCTADPGWVTGTSYGMFAPFTQRRDEPRSTRAASAPTSGTSSSRSTRSRSGTRRRRPSAC